MSKVKNNTTGQIRTLADLQREQNRLRGELARKKNYFSRLSHWIPAVGETLLHFPAPLSRNTAWMPLLITAGKTIFTLVKTRKKSPNIKSS
ncbi:MAG: hypothetical protein LBR51_00585 [Bacteroidales bacterium]|jgi:hypothetical protein|nr:hypothetical protein [Bacteroidales bacterium]